MDLWSCVSIVPPTDGQPHMTEKQPGQVDLFI